MIDDEYLEREEEEDLVKKMGIYNIEIRNFREKLGKAKMGEKVSTKKFFVNWSEFSIDIYIAGDDDSDGEHLSLYLTNHSNWMVRALKQITVQNKVLELDQSAGFVYKSRIAGSGNSWGWSSCVPLARCYNNDLLTNDGILKIEVIVVVLAENIPGGGGAVHAEISELKRKLDAQDNEIRDLKSKVHQVEIKRNC